MRRQAVLSTSSFGQVQFSLLATILHWPLPTTLTHHATARQSLTWSWFLATLAAGGLLQLCLLVYVWGIICRRRWASRRYRVKASFYPFMLCMMWQLWQGRVACEGRNRHRNPACGLAFVVSVWSLAPSGLQM